MTTRYRVNPEACKDAERVRFLLTVLVNDISESMDHDLGKPPSLFRSGRVCRSMTILDLIESHGLITAEPDSEEHPE